MAQIGLLEDNVRIARLCATMLQYAGHQVTVYEHPRQCLDDLLVTSSSPPIASAKRVPLDMLIIDLNLPDISGLEVVNSLLAHPLTKSLPLIFCTAASALEINQVLQLTPHACCIGKPFTYQELTSAVSGVEATLAH
ncbi:MAG: response regulator [Ktedonobacteraceae bacterium]|nr:response regulator [Ktedonobacteraceae bacterium]MBO0790563.1 response regulator [Ktedonobacteraceae bacterium]